MSLKSTSFSAHNASIQLFAALGLLLSIAMPMRAQAPTPVQPAAPAATNLPVARSLPAAPTPATVEGGTIHGTVVAGAAPTVQTGAAPATAPKVTGTPLPGVVITATNSLTGKRYATTTDATGSYTMTIPKNGRYVIKAEFSAFAPSTQQALLNNSSHNQTANFGLQLASRAAAEEARADQATAGASARTGGTRAGGTRTGAGTQMRRAGAGNQSLSLEATDSDIEQVGGQSSDTGASLPSIAGAGDLATDSVTVSGATGQTNTMANMSEDDIRQRIDQARAQGGGINDVVSGLLGPGGGGFGGGGGGFGGGGGGFGGGRGGGGGGNFRGFNPGQPHGALFYVAGNSALNAAPFSVRDNAIERDPQPPYDSNNYGASFSGSPYIPGLVKASPRNNMFLNFTGTKSSSPSNSQAVTVPTTAERSGDFSATGLAPIYNNQAYTASCGVATGAQYTYNGVANVIPPGCLSSQAEALLQYYPGPNLSGTTNNYLNDTTTETNTNAIAGRFMHNFGALQQGRGGRGGGGGGRGNRQAANAPPTLRQNVNLNYSYSHSAQDKVNTFPGLGGKSQAYSNALTVGYSIGYGHLTNNFSLAVNRTHSTTSNYFQGQSNVDGTAGILLGANSSSFEALPLNNTVPKLNFSVYSDLSGTNPSDSVNQTLSFTEGTIYSHKKHNMRYGFDYRRVESNALGGGTPAGNYTFTGYGTLAPGTTITSGAQTSGIDFADFLLGLPQDASVSAGSSKYYLRGNVLDGYALDDWRLASGLSLNFGLRYEYFSPYTEKYNHMANLDANSTFTSIAEVLPGQTGSVTGTHYPGSLVYPNRANFSPRIAFAYKVPKLKNTVVRGGYGINYNNAQFSGFAKSLAFQPLSNDPGYNLTQTNGIGDSGCTIANMTLGNAFSNCGAATSNNFAVNPHYRLGNVNVWNLNVQRTVGMGIVLNIGYTGSKGTHLDTLTAPNRSGTGLSSSTTSAFEYETSIAFAKFNAFTFGANKRLAHGLALGANYQYGHSFDDASSIGGAGSSIAQNPTCQTCEEGRSTFDVRHQVSGTWLYELPVGPNHKLFPSGKTAEIFGGFNLSGTYSFATGTPLTPTYGATIATASQGVTGTERPDRVSGVSLTSGGGRLTQWFNPAAFTTPAGIYGTAARDSITGPGTLSINMSLSRTIQLGGTHSLEFRATANNAFNTTQYSSVNTTLNSTSGVSTFGQVSGIATRRTISVTARYRF